MKFKIIGKLEASGKNILEFFFEDMYINKILNMVDKIEKLEARKKKRVDLDITIDINYKPRTLDQNALMWELYTIEAMEMNGGMIGPEAIKPEKLYEDDLKLYAPKMRVLIQKKYAHNLKSEYRMITREKDYSKYFTDIETVISSSHWNTLQMSKWIEMLFNRLARTGVSDIEDIHNYWMKWRQYLNDEKIILNNNLIDAKEYKAKNPSCEACGVYIGDGSGQLSHIKSRGSAGISEDKSDDWLHLCHSCHIKTQHQKGWKYFLQFNPHLKYKINKALNQE